MRSQVNNNIQEKFSDILCKLHEQNSIVSFDNGVYKLPSSNIGCLTLTGCAGGGAGQIGIIKNGIFYSGGGGGAGESLIKKPILIFNPNKEEIVIETKIGKGGKTENNQSGDGTNTVVVVKIGNVISHTYKILGGKQAVGGTNVTGGQGGYDHPDTTLGGYDGSNGIVSLPENSSQGGKGGNSAFAEGGKGGFDTVGENGTLGSGGGGNIVGFDTFSSGGDGFVIVEI